MTEFYLGLDLGQSADYSALAISEVQPIETGEAIRKDPVYLGQGPGLNGGLPRPIYEVRERRVPVTERRYDIRELRRWQLGTSYTTIVADMVAMLDREPLRSSETTLVLDLTGVGRPVRDMFLKAKPRGRLVPVTITGGSEPHRDGSAWRTPKRDLVSCAQVLLQGRRLKIAPTLAEAAVLVHELESFRVKISDGGHDSYAAWRETDHDDLLLATCLAIWVSEHGRLPKWGVV